LGDEGRCSSSPKEYRDNAIVIACHKILQDEAKMMPTTLGETHSSEFSDVFRGTRHDTVTFTIDKIQIMWNELILNKNALIYASLDQPMKKQQALMFI
jgi:hypothetical protein